MKKVFTTILTAIIGGSCCTCGSALSVEAATYRDSGIMTQSVTIERINYENKTTDTYNMVLRHPNYTSSPYASSCACIAGANLVGFYDRYDEELIPNHQSGTVFHGQFLYSMEDTYVTEVVKQLYADMGTDDGGTSVDEFKSGMLAFCSRKGKGVSFTSCMKNKKFDYATAKIHMKNNLPVVLFCHGYNVANIHTEDKEDEIDYCESDGNHVMVGFGYQEITYTLSSSSSAVYEYIRVASGMLTRSAGYYNINHDTNIDDAYAINIY